MIHKFYNALRMKILMAMVMVSLLILLIVPTVLAAPGKQTEPVTLDNFLLWLIAGGSVVAVSWILEQVAWFQSLPSKTKQLVQYGASIAVGLAALAIQLYVPADVLDQLEPFFAVIASTFGMVFLNQIAHKVDNNRKE